MVYLVSWFFFPFTLHLYLTPNAQFDRRLKILGGKSGEKRVEGIINTKVRFTL